MTEDQAKTKWCPMVRSAESIESSVCNRYSERSDDSGLTDGSWNKCVASGCMMWKVVIRKGGGLLEDSGECGLQS